jgi:drug/metabolite transporter (DMT)-like permease
MVWSSLFAVPPLVLWSLAFEGPAAIAQGFASAGWGAWAAVLWQSAGNALFGYCVWAWLLARHPATAVAPMALLVPVFGMASSAWWLGEALPLWKIAVGDRRSGAEPALAVLYCGFGHKTHILSGCFMRPACASARSPQPQK